MENNKLTAKLHTDIVGWSKKVLKQSTINTIVVAQTPWSTVLKITTRHGSVYLKQTPPDLFIEVDIIQTCRQLCGIIDIPEVIAANKIYTAF